MKPSAFLISLVPLVENYMQTPDGQANIRLGLSKGGTMEGAISLCVAQVSGFTDLEVVLEVAREVMRKMSLKAPVSHVPQGSIQEDKRYLSQWRKL
jgi:hypothetical protein